MSTEAASPPRTDSAEGTPPAGARRIPAAVRAHLGITIVVSLGLVLRVLTTLAYIPALWFPDSAHYLASARSLGPDTLRPLGYSLLLRALSPAGSLLAVSIVQHLLGLAAVVGIYVVLYRRGLPRWLAVLAAAPMALDAYEAQIEQYVLSETMFTVVLLVAIGVLCRRSKPGTATMVISGLLFALAGLTRTVGLPLAVLAVGYLLIRRVGWRRVLAFAAAVIIPVLAYSVDFRIAHGTYSVTSSSGRFLYGRAAMIVDCARVDGMDAQQRSLCAATVQSQPRAGSEWYDWNRLSPGYDYIHDAAGEAVLSGFAGKVILAQPVDFARLVARDSAHYFAPGRSVSPQDACDEFWRYTDIAPTAMQTCDSGAVKVGWLGPATVDFARNPAGHHVDSGIVQVLRAYQRVGYTPGPLLAACVLAALATVLVRLDPVGRRLRVQALLVAATGVALVVIPSATAVFDYRYGLPLIALCPLAGALAWGAFTHRRSPPGGQ